MQGQTILSGEAEIDIDVTVLPSGIYLLQLQQENNLYQAIKFVKQ